MHPSLVNQSLGSETFRYYDGICEVMGKSRRPMQPTAKPNYLIPKIEINWEISESRAFGKDTFTDLDFTVCATKSGSLSLENFSLL